MCLWRGYVEAGVVFHEGKLMRFHQIMEISKLWRFQLVRDKTTQGDSKLKQIHIIVDILELREVVPMARICRGRGRFSRREIDVCGGIYRNREDCS